MSQLIWSSVRRPSKTTPIEVKTYPIVSHDIAIENTREIKVPDRDLIIIPDPRAYRSMSRTSLMLSSITLESKSALQPFIDRDCFRIGIYAAIDATPEEYESIKALPDDHDAEFVLIYKKLRSPKQYFKQLPNLTAAQLGIFLNITGPIYTFTHLKYGSLHALDQAESDLFNNVIDTAVVGSAFTFEDPLMSLYVRQKTHPTTTLCEGAGCLILVRNDVKTCWKDELYKVNSSHQEESFGISTNLILYILQKTGDHRSIYHEN